jgi:signal transduction histidine kinase
MGQRDLADTAGRFDLSLLACKAVQLLAPEGESQHPVIRIDAPGPCWVHGSARQIEHAILNLVTNAIQATGAGGLIRVSVRHRGKLATLEVADNGPGLPREALARLFEPFTSTKPGGTGLGLALTRHIARLSGGDLRLISTSSEGTRFQLRLPIAEHSGDGASHDRSAPVTTRPHGAFAPVD